MRKLKKKSITMIISMLLVFVGLFTWLTFSLSRAAEHDDMAPGETEVSNVKTNIDLIIQNSNDTEKEDNFRQYHIVEISSGNPGTFAEFCQIASGTTETKFELLVLNEHRTKQMLNDANQIIDTAVFCPGYIDFKAFNLHDLRAGANDSAEITEKFKPVLAAVVNADLIYIHCDATSKDTIYSADSDFTTELTNALTLYTTNDLKPVIIDSPTKVADELLGSSKTFQYIGAAFGESGSARNTFAWDFDPTANPNDTENPREQLNPSDAVSYFTRSTPSKFLPISGRDVQGDKWVSIKYDGKDYNAARILTVKAGGGDNPITDKVMEGLGSEVDVSIAGTSDTAKAQRIYAGVDVEEEELIEEEPDDNYDIYNPLSAESGSKANLTINATFTGNDDASYNPTASARLHIRDYQRNEYKSDINVSDGSILSYDNSSHAYVINFTKDNASITLEDIPVECIFSIETTNDDITDADTYDDEGNKAYLPYRVLTVGDNIANLSYKYIPNCGVIENTVFYENNVIEPGVRSFYFALFNDSNGELRTPGFDIREVRMGNGADSYVNLEWDGVPYGNYYVLETDSLGNALDGGRLAVSAGQELSSEHRVSTGLKQLNGTAFASHVKISFNINDIPAEADPVPAFQFKIVLRDEKGKLVTGSIPAVLNDGSTNNNIFVTFKNGLAVSTIGTEEVEAVEIPYEGFLNLTVPDQYKYKITEVSPLKQFEGEDRHYRYNAGNFNDYVVADYEAKEEASADHYLHEYVFVNDYVESFGSALFYAYKIYEQHPDFVIHDTLEYDATNDAKNFSNFDTSKYDLIIFEGNLQSVLLATGKNDQPDDYNTLKSYMKSKTVNGYYNHIIYASNICPENGNIQGYTFAGADNFMKYYNSLMIKTDVPNGAYSVLLTSPNEMTANTGENATADTVEDIAELINKGRYRFTGGKADVTNRYSVLEIQPCYPIDLQLAAVLTKNKSSDDAEWVAEKRRTSSSGYYYLDYDNVLNGYTKDEIAYGTYPLGQILDDGTITSHMYGDEYEVEEEYQAPIKTDATSTTTTFVSVTSNTGMTQFLNDLTSNNLGAYSINWYDGTLQCCTYSRDGVTYYIPGHDHNANLAIGSLAGKEFYGYVEGNRCAIIEYDGTSMETTTQSWDGSKNVYTTISYAKSGNNLIRTTEKYGVNGYETKVGKVKKRDYVATDYYDWEVSPAKILHILQQTDSYKNFKIDDIVVDHMSTEEFICSKKSLLDNYDMIYIGGNNSAIKDLSYFVANSSGNNSSNHNIGGVNNATYYNMYFHNGDLFKYHPYVKGYVNNSYGVQLGNDLTLSKYDELIDYANNDMPIIVSKTLAQAFDNSQGSYSKHQIDPDSRMYALLNAIKSKGNVGWGVDTITTQRIDMADLEGVNYAPDGHTIYSNSVTFYNSTAEGIIKNLINTHGSRPKYQVSYAPDKYNLYDPSKTLQTRDLNFEFSIQNIADLMKNGHTFTAYLYLDDNGDSKFDLDKEEVDSKPGQLGKVEHTVPDDFFGAVYLQLTISDRYTGTDGKSYEQRSSQRFLCKIDPPSEEKDKINILQILPDGGQLLNGLKATKGTELDTLFFCTECQLAGGILEGGTRAGGDGQFSSSVFKRDGSGKKEPGLTDNDVNSLIPGVSQVQTIKSNIEAYEHANGSNTYSLLVNNLGAHNHIFGIPTYKSLNDAREWAAILGTQGYTGIDDYNANLADYIDQDYDFNMEIMETTEFNTLVSGIVSEYAGKSATDRNSIKLQHNDNSREYELYYDILNTLMDSDLKDGTVQNTYYSAVLNKINTEYGAIAVDNTGTPSVGVNVLRDLRDQLKIFYSDNGLTWTSNDSTFESMSLGNKYTHVGTIINTAATNTGYNQAGATNFYDFMLDKYGYSDTDMKNFESFMHELGASVADIRSFAGSRVAIDKYITDTIMPIVEGNDTCFGGKHSPLVKRYLEAMMRHKAYADYYSLQNDSNPSNDNNGTSGNWSGTLAGYTSVFKPWRNAGIYRKYLRYKYMDEAKRGAVNDNGDVDFTTLYSIIIVGPADDFNGKDMADPSTKALQTYIDNDGRVLLFYDTINVNRPGSGVQITAGNGAGGATGGSQMALNLTTDLRETFGQDARHVSELKYGPNLATSEKYYISTLSTNNAAKVNNSWNLVPEGITDRSIVFGTDKGQADAGYMDAYMYKYGAYLYYEEGDNTRFESHHVSKNEVWKRSVTDKASRNNEGILTMYPFPLKPVLNITGTNPQGYNLDIEDEDMTVYYTLSGGTSASGANPASTNSSLMAATPNDGVDNYFIYQYKNVTYCGAGNSVVTGLGTDNNDERMLFINIIVNSLRKSAIGTQVKLYDALKTDPNTGNVTNPMANAKVKPTGTGLYEIEAKSTTDSPEFSFYIKTDKNVSITRVTAYYDLDLAQSNGEILALSKSHPYDEDTFDDGSTNIKHQDGSGNALREHVLIYDTGTNMANLRDADKDLNRKQRNVNLGIVKNDDPSVWNPYSAGLQGVTPGQSSNGNYYAAGCNLELRDDYFKPYDGAYTFITVRVETKDSKGRDLAPIYRRIKVVLPYDLFDLN